MILIIDNYDSFTYNLYQYIGMINSNVQIVTNNQITTAEITDMDVSHIVISPGPGKPEDAGISVDVIKTFGEKIPILGVCLGHQAIITAFGGRVVKAKKIIHGKTSLITHNSSLIFDGMNNPFKATRYHSLIAKNKYFPEDLIITAKSNDNQIMAIEHIKNPLYGLQFHPESIETENGLRLIKNFLKIKP